MIVSGLLYGVILGLILVFKFVDFFGWRREFMIVVIFYIVGVFILVFVLIFRFDFWNWDWFCDVCGVDVYCGDFFE